MIFSKKISDIKNLIKLHQMDYIPDQQGIMNRYFREKENWDLHIKHTKEFILESAKTKKKNRAIVLGSGWLLDLPLEELAVQFKEIILIDIIHPKQILKRIKKYKNVKLINDDITGGLIDFCYKNKKNKTLITTIDSFHYYLQDADFIVSLNIMCQLHIILIDYLKKYNQYTNQEINLIEKHIQQSHLNILPNGKSCLITDLEEEIYDEENNLLGVNQLIHIDLPISENTLRWTWKFDTKMTYRPDSKTYFNTIAVDF